MQKSPFIEIGKNLIDINRISRIYEDRSNHIAIVMGSEILGADYSFSKIKEIIDSHYKNS